jgi:hypothetical protein
MKMGTWDMFSQDSSSARYDVSWSIEEMDFS